MIKIKPKIYILPGWGHKISDKNYQRLISIVTKKYKFIKLKISTRNRKYALGSKESLTKIVQKIEKQIIKPCSDDTILGFSIGALQAYELARLLKFKHVVLCSISPVLGSDLLSYPKKEVIKTFSTQYKEMVKMNYALLINKKITLFYGEKEPDILKKRVLKLAKRKGYKAIEVKDGDHVLDERYLNEIKKVLI